MLCLKLNSATIITVTVIRIALQKCMGFGYERKKSFTFETIMIINDQIPWIFYLQKALLLYTFFCAKTFKGFSRTLHCKLTSRHIHGTTTIFQHENRNVTLVPK